MVGLEFVRESEAWLDRNRWFAEVDEMYTADFNLSANRHRPQSRARVEHRDPLEILDELRAIETEIFREIDLLADAVREAVVE